MNKPQPYVGEMWYHNWRGTPAIILATFRNDKGMHVMYFYYGWLHTHYWGNKPGNETMPLDLFYHYFDPPPEYERFGP